MGNLSQNPWTVSQINNLVAKENVKNVEGHVRVSGITKVGYKNILMEFPMLQPFTNIRTGT